MNSLDLHFAKLARQHFTNLGMSDAQMDLKIAYLLQLIQEGSVTKSSMISIAKMGLESSSK